MQEINKKEIKIAYFSMEIALESWIKSYSGGLGVLAGDTLKSAADLQIPMLGITILNKKGFFKQKINKEGEQIEVADNFRYKKLKKMKERVSVKIGDDKVIVQAWQYCLISRNKTCLPIYFLDTDITGNKQKYRDLSGELYKADPTYRLMQEIILGRAGVKILSALNYNNINKYHLNEGHAALATVELYSNSSTKNISQRVKEIQEKCVFTTHTPIKAGHDVFPISLVRELQKDLPLKLLGLIKSAELNMTELALYFSGYVNGVAFSHQEVSAKMFPNHYIYSVTNGVHSSTWTSKEFQKLFDKHIPTWRSDNLSLRNAFNISTSEIWQAHQSAKQRLLDYIYKKQKEKLKLNVFTIGFARRFTGYKRSTLLFHDMAELVRINKSAGPMQIIYAGKAHPRDTDGKAMIKEIHRLKEVYKKDIKIIFLENYDMEIAKLMTAGVDVWLNTPLPPNEASGTSGMKAAHNGVPHFSTLDGWWVEGFVNRKTGWSIGDRRSTLNPKELNSKDATNLYNKLETRILPRYYKHPHNWQETMRYTIAINASFFNTQRMLQQYIQSAYL
ncbi:MAG: alpha-glucan family phosphorylase [Patescibacteria group bacterium]|nr:alpha-glucan family phosphorylase [Patescibacteria group bacterium]